MNEDHITMSNTPEGNYCVRCAHCGDTNTPSLPISIDGFLGAMKEFQRRHRHCKPKAEEEDGN